MRKEWIQILLDAVYEASEKIISIYHTNFDVELKDDRSPVTLADKESSQIILKHLIKTKILIISEEELKPTYEKRKNLEYIWLVDPLDGTREFVRKNGEFCINIALIKNNKPIFGMIASPTEQKIIFGGQKFGAFYINYFEQKYLDKKFKIKPITAKKKKGLVYSRSHFTPGVSTLINQLENKYGTLEITKKGSALKFFDLVLNDAQFYPRMAPTMEWDIAAGQAIYESIGGEVLNFTNFEALVYNKTSLINPNFIAKPKDLSIN